METDLPEPVVPSLGKIGQAADKAKGITRQILTFGRQGQSLKTPNDIVEITGECIELIKVGIPAWVHLGTDIQSGPFPVTGERTTAGRYGWTAPLEKGPHLPLPFLPGFESLLPIRKKRIRS
jgi:hypothetical protein